MREGDELYLKVWALEEIFSCGCKLHVDENVLHRSRSIIQLFLVFTLIKKLNYKIKSQW